MQDTFTFSVFCGAPPKTVFLSESFIFFKVPHWALPVAIHQPMVELGLPEMGAGNKKEEG